MQAVVLTGHGGLDKLVIHDDWPTPIPEADDVLIRVGACLGRYLSQFPTNPGG